MRPENNPRWIPVVVLASLYVFYSVVQLAAGDGGWPQIVGIPIGIALGAYSVARYFGWEGIER